MRLILLQPTRIPRIEVPKGIPFGATYIIVVCFLVYYFLVISLVICIEKDYTSAICKDM